MPPRADTRRAWEPCTIVGAGLAGSAAAVLLARGGVYPLLLERTATPQPRICGEFISTEAVAALAALDVNVHALGGQRTRRLRLACGALRIEAELPFEAVGLSRQALDGALQQAAVDAGVRLWRGQRVAITQVADGSVPFTLQLGDEATGRRLHTPSLLLACGKTDLAPVQRRLQRVPEPLVGWQLRLHLQPAQRAALEGCVEVALFDGGYAGLQAVEGDRVNLCLLARRHPEHPADMGLEALLKTLQQACPLLAERLEGARWAADPPQSIFRVPYGHLHQPTPHDPPGLWRLGDQAVVIPSFTGDGMAIALHSAALAAGELLRGHSAAHYHRQLLRDVGPQVRRAQALYRAGHTRFGRGALLALLQRWPALLGVIAAMTRVPAAALRL